VWTRPDRCANLQSVQHVFTGLLHDYVVTTHARVGCVAWFSTGLGSDFSVQRAVQAAFDAVLRMMGSSREEFTEQMKAAASDSPAEVWSAAASNPFCCCFRLFFKSQSAKGLFAFSLMAFGLYRCPACHVLYIVSLLEMRPSRFVLHFFRLAHVTYRALIYRALLSAFSRISTVVSVISPADFLQGLASQHFLVLDVMTSSCIVNFLTCTVKSPEGGVGVIGG
jgi:hypothetical protein